MKKKNKIRDGSVLSDIFLHIGLFLLAIITLYPLVYVISNAISDPIASATGQVWLLPKVPVS